MKRIAYKIPQFLGLCITAFGLGLMAYGIDAMPGAVHQAAYTEFRQVMVAGQVVAGFGIAVWAIGRVGEWLDEEITPPRRTPASPRAPGLDCPRPRPRSR